MKYFTLLFILIAISSLAQEQKTLQLKAIQMQNNLFGTSYYYGGKNIESGYALQIPLQEMNDKQINKDFLAYKKFNSSASLTSFIPFIYLSSKGFNTSNSRDLAYVFAGTLASGIIIRAVGRKKMKNAIFRYNQLIVK